MEIFIILLIMAIVIVAILSYKKRVTNRSKVDSAVCTIGTSISKKN